MASERESQASPIPGTRDHTSRMSARCAADNSILAMVRPPVLLSKIITFPLTADEPRSPMQPDIESFRTELRQWLAANFPREDGPGRRGSARDPQRHRYLQTLLSDGGFAGLTYPEAYGGRGLTPDFQDVFNEEAVGYELPTLFNVTLGILGPTILDFGSEEQKRRHLPAILR